VAVDGTGDQCSICSRENARLDSCVREAFFRASNDNSSVTSWQKAAADFIGKSTASVVRLVAAPAPCARQCSSLWPSCNIGDYATSSLRRVMQMRRGAPPGEVSVHQP
jgi:hypothetical protein